MKGIRFNIPDDLHRKLRTKLSSEGKQAKELFVTLTENYVGKNDEKIEADSKPLHMNVFEWIRYWREWCKDQGDCRVCSCQFECKKVYGFIKILKEIIEKIIK